MTPMLVLLLLVLAAEAAFTLYLSGRQIAHVRAHRGAVPADFADTVDLASHQKAADYTVARARLGRVQAVFGFALTCLWLIFGLDALSATVAGISGPNLARSVAIVIAFGIISEVVALPFQAYRTFVIENRFGFNRTTPLRFLADLLKGGLVSVVVTIPLLLGAFWLMHHASGLGWLYGWAAFVAISFGLSEAYPRWIAPLFNRFTPLEGPLRDRVAALIRRCGFRASRLFIMDASKRSAHGNAYFTGLGKAKRIVLFDTLIEKHPEDEIEAVLAHELGHFKFRHALVGMAQMILVSFVAFAAFGTLGTESWLTSSLGLTHHDDALTLIVFMMWASALGPVVRIIGNAWSRRAEFQADAFARRMVGAEPMINALVRLTRDSAGTLTPDPVYALVNYTHPPVPVRVAHLRNAR